MIAMKCKIKFVSKKLFLFNYLLFQINSIIQNILVNS